MAALVLALALMALACSGGEVGNLVNEGNKLGNDERWTEAIALYDQAILVDSEHAEAYNNRGYAYFKLGEYGRAIEDLSEAIRLKPKERGYWANRGLIYILIGRDEEGQRDLDQAEELGEPRFRLERAVEDIMKER